MRKREEGAKKGRGGETEAEEKLNSSNVIKRAEKNRERGMEHAVEI